MGTRHQIEVIAKKELRVAQYGQWDGYPTGQGEDIAEFIQAHIKDADWTKERTIENFTECVFLTAAQTEQLENLTQSFKLKSFVNLTPHLSRDTGAKLLELIKDKPLALVKNDDLSWCEYKYIINFDSATVEVIELSREKRAKVFSFEDCTKENMQKLETEWNEEEEAA